MLASHEAMVVWAPMKTLPGSAAKNSPFVHPRIAVAAPVLDGREIEYVLECLSTSWISSKGRFINEFEKAFAGFCDVKHAVATCNGTAALHLALVGLGLKPGDEVIVPTLTYIASANVVRYCGATPVFVDNDVHTFNMDVEAVAAKITARTKGIMPVHLYGHPVDLDPLLRLAHKHNLFLLEDAAEAVGACYKGRRLGGHGDCCAFSFFGNKIITTGEGGMVTTNDDALASRLRLFRGQGMDPQQRYWFQVVGYNYRMTNVAAAIGLAQLERVDFHLQARKRIVDGYNRRLAHLSDWIDLPKSEVWAEHAYWMYTILLRESVAKSRDLVMQDLDDAGIETRPVFYPLHRLPPYRDAVDRSFPRAELCGSRGINLPTHGRLTEQDLDRIAEAIEFSIT
jgi:perosamine synthetase